MKEKNILDGHSTELRNIMCYFYFYAPFEIVARSLYFDPFAWYQTWYCGWPSRVDDPLGFQVAGSTDKVKPIVSFAHCIMKSLFDSSQTWKSGYTRKLQFILFLISDHRVKDVVKPVVFMQWSHMSATTCKMIMSTCLISLSSCQIFMSTCSVHAIWTTTKIVRHVDITSDKLTERHDKLTSSSHESTSLFDNMT